MIPPGQYVNNPEFHTHYHLSLNDSDMQVIPLFCYWHFVLNIICACTKKTQYKQLLIMIPSRVHVLSNHYNADDIN